MYDQRRRKSDGERQQKRHDNSYDFSDRLLFRRFRRSLRIFHFRLPAFLNDVVCDIICIM